jgi:hypothetical protein
MVNRFLQTNLVIVVVLGWLLINRPVLFVNLLGS